MGLVRMGPPKELILQLRDALGLGWFVETGTYEGRTAAWAADHFERVVTFELSRPHYERAAGRLGHLANVQIQFGDSREGLRALGAELASPALFWLDGHWSGGETYGADDECPLLAELDALRDATADHAILIDDARLFASPPPRPHRIAAWPTMTDVFDELRAIQPECYIVIHDDCIVAVPQAAQKLVAEYCQKKNTEAWLKNSEPPPSQPRTSTVKVASFCPSMP